MDKYEFLLEQLDLFAERTHQELKNDLVWAQYQVIIEQQKAIINVAKAHTVQNDGEMPGFAGNRLVNRVVEQMLKYHQNAPEFREEWLS